MRALVFVLIFANLLFFAYTQGYFGKEISPDAERLAQQVKPERLQLLWRPGEAPITPLAATPEASDQGGRDGLPPDLSAADPSPVAPLAPSAVPDAQAASAPSAACFLLSGLQIADADRLAAQAMAARLVVTQRGESWWVFIPPQPDRATAERKAGELTALGVKDFFIVNEGPQQFAISLGNFSREETANRRLEELRVQKVRSARVGPRRQENARQTLEIRGDALTALSFRQTLPSGVVTRDCP
jgi:cell division septation protein DedD